MLDADGIAQLREALDTAGFTAPGVAARIGPAAMRAARRNDFRAVLRTTVERDRLATLVRVFLAGQTESTASLTSALAPLPLAAALAAGLIEPHGDGLRAAIDLDIYGDWWVLADLDAEARPGPLRADHVLGVGSAATTLIDATMRDPVTSALDIGTGCGVQALHLSGHAAQVTATDLSDRALRFAATTAALNGLSWELLAVDLLTPVAGRRFDLVVSNPPFVVGPGVTRYAYRDSDRPADAVCAELAAAAAAVLTEGGVMQFLANWLHVAGEDWQERVAGWVGAGCDAWIIQREVCDPVEYVTMWLRDAAEPVDPARVQAWLDWFDAAKVDAVGFGLVTLRRGAGRPVVRVEELRQAVSAPLGAQVSAWFDRQDWLAGHDGAALLPVKFGRADELRLIQEAAHDGEDWAVSRQRIALASGLRWAEEVDPVVLALLSGADGTVTLHDLLAVLAAATGTTEPELEAMALPVVAHLVERGYLTPVE
ncbi:MAG: methyltransferase [Micromonosporaceae bacterium]